MNARRIAGAFKRASSIICLVILVTFCIQIASIAYHCLAYERSEFLGKEEVREYENAVEEIMGLDEWQRTQRYWGHNSLVGGVRLIPGAGAVIEFASAYRSGIYDSYRYHHAGADIFLGFIAGIFVHGIFEMTGVFILAALSLYIIKGGLRGEIWKRRFQKDYVILVVIGFLLIFLGGPIEAYITPRLLSEFYGSPPLSVGMLAAVAFFYVYVFFIRLGGARQMREDIRVVLRRRLSG